LSLDENGVVLNVNRSLAGSAFPMLSASRHQELHTLLHPDCEGRCRFMQMWTKAWECLESRDAVEWEVDDPVTGRHIRLNLSNPPTPGAASIERRQRHILLTITDITRYRREYESLVEKQEALVRLLMSRGEANSEAVNEEFDDQGDTGNRLMAEYVQQSRSVGRQLIAAQEEERRRIAQELHDGIAQTVGGLKYKVETVVCELARKNPDLDLRELMSSVDELKALAGEIRRISRNLSPSMLEDFGLQVSLEWLCKEFSEHNPNVRARCRAELDESETPELVKIAIYRIAQEALNNAARHASATLVDLELTYDADGIRLTIRDDGSGFEPGAIGSSTGNAGGLGLRSMRERAAATGGRLEFDTAAGKGVTIRAVWSPADWLGLIR